MSNKRNKNDRKKQVKARSTAKVVNKVNKFNRGDYITFNSGYTEVIGIVMGGDCANVQNLTLGYKGRSDGVVFPVDQAKKLPAWKVEHLKDCGYLQCERILAYER